MQNDNKMETNEVDDFFADHHAPKVRLPNFSQEIPGTCSHKNLVSADLGETSSRPLENSARNGGDKIEFPVEDWMMYGKELLSIPCRALFHIYREYSSCFEFALIAFTKFVLITAQIW